MGGVWMLCYLQSSKGPVKLDADVLPSLPLRPRVEEVHQLHAQQSSPGTPNQQTNQGVLYELAG